MPTTSKKNDLLEYKGHPLMRKDNIIYYGSMSDSHIIMMQILDSADTKDLPVAKRVSVQLQQTGSSVYSTSSPSISTNAMPVPDRRCMIKPSPPKKPAPSFLLKWIDSSTPSVEARNALFWSTNSRPGAISRGTMRPGKQEPNVIMPSPRAV